ncbi:MAG: hypothetical protein ACOCV8_03415, partial [Spirochaetota bacterium]
MAGLDKEEKEKYYNEKYKGKFKFAGNKHNSVKFTLDIINNKRTNPKNLFVAEGLWALEMVKQYKLYTETFFFCPEIIYTPEAEAIT